MPDCLEKDIGRTVEQIVIINLGFMQKPLTFLI